LQKRLIILENFYTQANQQKRLLTDEHNTYALNPLFAMTHDAYQAAFTWTGTLIISSGVANATEPVNKSALIPRTITDQERYAHLFD